ncbi:2-C-methyl-D-erythritol 2,4-cyclodiphosphate synthase [bacterium]|nr:MAG: 2-C-methyl-D-erythritol 2,4-cyclodiphosphate synthase [bacterium]
MFRVGIGYDIHRLVSGRRLVLGGMNIPFKKGLLAHSDGDVLAHAIGDALLGAAGLGDIGIHFPDTNKRFKDISSLRILSDIHKKVSRAGFRIQNVDSVLIADRPKISAYRAAMIDNLSAALHVAASALNLKATTSEGVGEVGSKSIASYAVALLKKR